MKKKQIFTALFIAVLLITSHQTNAQAEKAEAAIQQLINTEQPLTKVLLWLMMLY